MNVFESGRSNKPFLFFINLYVVLDLKKIVEVKIDVLNIELVTNNIFYV